MKTSKSLGMLLGFIIAYCSGYAQNTIETDKKIIFYKNQIALKPDSTCYFLNKLGMYYYEIEDNKKALEFFFKCDSRTLNDTFEMKSEYVKSLTYFGIELYDRALYHNLKSLHLAQSMGNRNFEVNNLIQIAALYRNLNDFSESARYFDKALKTVDSKDNETLFWIYYHRGYKYYMENRTEDAIGDYTRAMEYAKQIHPYLLIYNYNELGNAYLKQNHDSAIYYLNKSIAINIRETGMFTEEQYVQSLFYKAKYYRALGNYEMSRNVIAKSKRLLKDDKNSKFQAKYAMEMMLYYNHIQELDSSAFYAE